MILEERVKQVAQARDTLGKLKKWKADALMVWEMEHKQQLADIETQSAKLTELESNLRIAALANFEATKNKQPAKGVGIRETTVLEYGAELALNWAREHKIALVPESLDVKKFEKYVASTTTKEVPVTAEGTERVTISTEVPFVTIKKVPSATIATDLSSYLTDVANVDDIIPF